MGVKVEISKAGIAKNIGREWQKILRPLSEQVLADCNYYCKQDTGNLIASSEIRSRPEEGILVWKTPYARRQYWTIRTASHDQNPNATWRWCEAAKRKHKADWAKLAQKLLEGK